MCHVQCHVSMLYARNHELQPGWAELEIPQIPVHWYFNECLVVTHSETFHCCLTFQNPRIRLCGFKKLETGCYCRISGMHICTMGWLDLSPINLTSGSVLMELGFDHVQNRKEETRFPLSMTTSTLVPVLHWMGGRSHHIPDSENCSDFCLFFSFWLPR